ncbi:MAG: hypothetical protein NTV52_20955, partial [Acidobacteria bacterium]|nr:hypothetical protein [Acidobacteriota bacterium]
SLAVDGPEEVEWAAAAGQLRGETAGKGEGKRGLEGECLGVSTGIDAGCGRGRRGRRSLPYAKYFSKRGGSVSKMR